MKSQYLMWKDASCTNDLLPPEVAQEMSRRGPRAKIATIAACGHAPALNVPDQLNLVERFWSAK